MRSSERALRTLQTEVGFELSRIGLELAQVAAQIDRSREQVDTMAHRCEAIAEELRGALHRSVIDLSLLSAGRQLYRAEQHLLQAARIRLVGAEKREQQLRDVLAELRKRQDALERALKGEQRGEETRRQAADFIYIDDLWLQQALTESSS